jgi:predicted glycoside hydrolase/deacetylase ChbG (UPF0249 family)
LSKCSFGVHLNATEFRPLTHSAALAPLLGPDGEMAGNIRTIPLSAGLRMAIYDEWCAQVQRIIDLGVNPSHLDSHQHVHTIPGLFPVLKRVQQRFGIHKVRISMNIYPIASPPPKSLLMRKFIWNKALSYYHQTITTSAFTRFETFFEVLRVHDVRHRSIELMAHPGNPSFQTETDLLVNQWWQELPQSVRRISFHELAGR